MADQPRIISLDWDKLSPEDLDTFISKNGYNNNLALAKLLYTDYQQNPHTHIRLTEKIKDLRVAEKFKLQNPNYIPPQKYTDQDIMNEDTDIREFARELGLPSNIPDTNLPRRVLNVLKFLGYYEPRPLLPKIPKTPREIEDYVRDNIKLAEGYDIPKGYPDMITDVDAKDYVYQVLRINRPLIRKIVSLVGITFPPDGDTDLQSWVNSLSTETISSLVQRLLDLTSPQIYSREQVPMLY